MKSQIDVSITNGRLIIDVQCFHESILLEHFDHCRVDPWNWKTNSEDFTEMLRRTSYTQIDIPNLQRMNSLLMVWSDMKNSFKPVNRSLGTNVSVIVSKKSILHATLISDNILSCKAVGIIAILDSLYSNMDGWSCLVIEKQRFRVHWT